MIKMAEVGFSLSTGKKTKTRIKNISSQRDFLNYKYIKILTINMITKSELVEQEGLRFSVKLGFLLGRGWYQI